MLARRFITVGLALVVIALSARGASAQLIEKKSLSLAAAKKMAAAAEAEAAKNKWGMVVSVVDEGGNLILLEHMDNAQLGSIDVSQRKARTALRFKRPTKVFEDALAAGRTAIITLGDVTASQGGLPVMHGDEVVGAIGVSGGTSEQDAQCAKAGMAALQLPGS